MAEFICKFGTPAGDILQEDYAADSEKALRHQMEEQGYYVFNIRRKMDPLVLVKSLIAVRRKKVTDKQFVIFNQELAALIHSGLPLLRSLELLMERIENPDFSAILQDIYRQVKSGVSLSEAFGTHPDVFPRVYTASILAGEKSGTLEQVIRRYLGYMKILLAIRSKVISSMVYPFLLLCLSFVVIGVLIGYVIPKFSEFYSGFGNELPFVTRFLIAAGNIFGHNWYFIVPGLILAVLLARLSISSSNVARRTFDRLKLRLPFLGRLWTKFSISQLMRTLHTLLAGGIPLVNAIDIAAGAVGNRLVSDELGHVSTKVKEGEPLWRSLDQTKMMTHMAIEMIKVGEETGALEDMLKNIADFYDEEIDTNLSTILSIVEPLMLVIMGLVIATILLAMYYPLFTAITTIHE